MRFDNSKALLLIFFSLLLSCKTNKEVPQHSNVLSNIAPSGVSGPELLELEKKLSAYKAAPARPFDLLHTSLDLTFDYENTKVKGLAELQLKPYFFIQNTVTLDAKDFDIHWINLIHGKDTLDVNFRYDSQKVTVFFPRAFTSNDTLKLRMKYTAFPNESSRPGSKAITDTKGLYFINPQGTENKPVQIWTQGETEHNSKWFPTFDQPNERHTQDIRLTVDKRYRTLSNGMLRYSKENGDGTRTDHWYMELPHAPYLAAVVVGEFAEIQDSWQGMQVNYYVEPAYEKGARKVFENTPEMIGFFSDLLGVKYPWSRYDQVVVRDFVSGAMENTTLSIFMEELNLDDREALDSEWDGIIAHELFHQWFGNLVTTESWSNLTLNEAFANYSEYLWYEYKLGRDEADIHHIGEMEQYFDEAKKEAKDLIRFYYEDGEDMFDSHSYAKGGRILHMLRRHLGDEAFFASLKHYLKKHAFSSVEVHDLRLAFEEVTGMDLNWFFNQWFLASGHPILAYDVDYSQPDNLLLTIEQQQDLRNVPLYRIPFKVSWYHEGQRFEKELILDKGRQQFAIENKVPIEQLFVDEKHELLAEKRTGRGVDFFISQFNNSEYAVGRYEALDSLINRFANDSRTPTLVKKSLQDSFWAIREMGIMGLASNPEWIQGEDWEETVFKLAENDPKHTVRLAAIEMLAAIDSDKYTGAFLRWMNHPSYYVAGAALSAYLGNEDNQNREEIAARFEKEKNIRMVAALAEYFIDAGVGGKESWFHEKMDQISGQSLYYYLGYFGDYFIGKEGPETEKAIQRLTLLAESHRANYIRIAAFTSLFGFVDRAEVMEKVREIYRNEQDVVARRYMEYFLGESSVEK